RLGRDGLLAGVDHLRVQLVLRGVRPHAEDAVLRVQRHVHALGEVAGDEGRHADAEVDVLAVGEVGGDPRRHLLMGPAHDRASSVAALLSFLVPTPVPWRPTSTMRCTKIPGTGTSAGSRAPGSTTSSAWTIVMRPAMAASGLKLRAVPRNCRFPAVSARWAWARAKSVTIERSGTYCSPLGVVRPRS